MSDDFISFGVNDDDVSGRRREEFKGKTGKTDRIALCWFKKDSSGHYVINSGTIPLFKKAEIHFHPSLGYFEDLGVETQKLFGTPKTKLLTIVIKYPTDLDGKLDKSAFLSGEFKILPWKLAPDKFRALKSINDEFPLVTTDLKVSCSDEKFQKMTFSACAGKALWMENEDIRKRVLNEVSLLELKVDLGRRYTLDEIKIKLGQETAPAPDATSGLGADDLLASLDD
jgi:hypothetical protein